MSYIHVNVTDDHTQGVIIHLRRSEIVQPVPISKMSKKSKNPFELYPGHKLQRGEPEALHRLRLTVAWHLSEYGEFEPRNLDQNNQRNKDAAAAGFPFTHKEIDLIAKNHGLDKRTNNHDRIKFVLKLANSASFPK